MADAKSREEQEREYLEFHASKAGTLPSDFEVAVQLRMLLRDQLNFEAICVRARDKIAVLSVALSASEAEVERLKAALDEREMFINPHLLEQAADEIDCGALCENIWWESDTNASGCRKSENGDYCPNDVAETLRAVAKVARAALTGEKP